MSVEEQKSLFAIQTSILVEWGIRDCKVLNANASDDAVLYPSARHFIPVIGTGSTQENMQT